LSAVELLHFGSVVRRGPVFSFVIHGHFDGVIVEEMNPAVALEAIRAIVILAVCFVFPDHAVLGIEKTVDMSRDPVIVNENVFTS
jgi:hypothetical protein